MIGLETYTRELTPPCVERLATGRCPAVIHGAACASCEGTERVCGELCAAGYHEGAASIVTDDGVPVAIESEPRRLVGDDLLSALDALVAPWPGLLWAVTAAHDESLRIWIVRRDLGVVGRAGNGAEGASSRVL